MYEELVQLLPNRNTESIEAEIKYNGGIKNYNPNIIKGEHKPWSKNERDIISNYLNHGNNKEKIGNIIYKELAQLLPNRTISSIKNEIHVHGKIENYNPKLIESSGELWSKNERDIISNYLNKEDNKNKNTSFIYKELEQLLPSRTLVSIKEEIRNHGKIENYNPNFVVSSHRLWSKNERDIINNYLNKEDNKNKSANTIYKELSQLLPGRTLVSIKSEIRSHGRIENYNPNSIN